MRALGAATALALAACSPAKPGAEGNRTAIVETPAPAVPTKAPALPPRAVPAPPPPAVLPEPPQPKPAEAPYRALGTEPFWAVRILDGVLTLERPDEAPRRFPVTRSAKGGVTQLSGEAIQVTIRPGACSDGMSDFTYADNVQLAFDGGTLKGCGGARSTADGTQP